MAILNNNPLIGAGGNQGYNINNSVRLRSSASAYLSRTPASASNRTTWTWSAWVKRGSLSVQQVVFFAGNVGTGSNYTNITFNADNTFTFENIVSGVGSPQLITTQVFRDPSAWYHIVAVYDSTQATSSNRAKLYINGTQVTAFGTATYPSLNQTSFVNSTEAHLIGASRGPANYFDGYLAEQNFIDGQALTPSSFGETDAITGVWKAKAYTGTYGTNGFYLKFSDIATTSGSNAGLGKDFSGNSNYWTTNNISVTSGTTYDAMTDSPTNTSATVANYAVWNAISVGVDATLSSGNLNIAYGTASTRTGTAATMGMSSGKYYWEISTVTQSGTFEPLIGITNSTLNSSTSSGIGIYPGYTANGWGYDATDGNKYTNGTGSAYGATWTSSDVMGVAFDADNGTLTFYKNNVSQGTAFTGLTSGPYFPAIGDGSTAGTFTMSANFGQRPFAYTPPTGYVALNTYNLPTPTILQGNKYMDATTYTGTGSSLAVTNAGAFKPDFLWVKDRSRLANHILVDSVRGVNNLLRSESTAAEAAGSFISSLNSNGFTLSANTISDSYYTNVSGDTFVGWQWQAGQGSTSSNTSGSITSTVSVNTTAGFSVVTYTGTGANATVGHGLGVAPSMLFVKRRNTTGNWMGWHTSLTGSGPYIILNSTNAVATGAWNNTNPTSTVFSLLGSDTDENANGSTYVAYCWAEIAGFSKFGSYTGNGSADGPFVYTGFRPRYLMLKRTDTAGYDWFVLDSARNTYNAVNNYLYPDLSNAEGSAFTVCDFLSNGFKFRDNRADWNGSGATYIFMAFAENPFKNSLAR